MMVRRFSALAAVCAAVTIASAQEPLSSEDIARVDAAVHTAFAFLYSLPSDTSAARMGTWVLDSVIASGDPERPRRWQILVTKLSDTGSALKMSEMIGEPGTTPAQLAAAMAAMQRLEGKISKAEAEAAIDVTVTVNDPEVTVAHVSDDAQRSKPDLAGAAVALRLHGDWMRVDDRELEVDYERWSPATLIVGFGGFGPIETRRAQPRESASTFTARARPPTLRRTIHTIAVTAQGNESMLDRVIKETNWDALAGLVK
jgi:hypothetical protein